MFALKDDPIISCMLVSGYPPWMLGRQDDEEDEDRDYDQQET